MFIALIAIAIIIGSISSVILAITLLYFIFRIPKKKNANDLEDMKQKLRAKFLHEIRIKEAEIVSRHIERIK